MKKVILFCVLLILMPVTASAAVSAEVIKGACADVDLNSGTRTSIKHKNTFKAGECIGAFSVIYSVLHTGTESGNQLFNICPPTNGTPSQYIAIFNKHASEHPEELHRRFFLVAIDSLMKAFPCP